jgi:hypothetical protein
LLAIVTPANLRSAQLLKKLGFHPSGMVLVEGESLNLHASEAPGRS